MTVWQCCNYFSFTFERANYKFELNQFSSWCHELTWLLSLHSTSDRPRMKCITSAKVVFKSIAPQFRVGHGRTFRPTSCNLARKTMVIWKNHKRNSAGEEEKLNNQIGMVDGGMPVQEVNDGGPALAWSLELATPRGGHPPSWSLIDGLGVRLWGCSETSWQAHLTADNKMLFHGSWCRG